MDDKKNVFIGALIALLLISAVWGQKETGRCRKLAKENRVMHTRLQEADDAVQVNSELRAEAARQLEARQQTAAQLDNARKKIEELQSRLAGMAEQEQALADLKAKKDQALAAVEEAKQALAAENAAQEQKLAEAAKMIEEENKRLAACEGKNKDCNQMRAAVDELDAANRQLEEERNKVLAEAETLRAQVIGLEKIVEERSATLAKTGKDLENCKLNNEILIGQIAQQQGKQEPKKGTQPMPKSKAEQQQAPATPAQKPVPQPVQQK